MSYADQQAAVSTGDSSPRVRDDQGQNFTTVYDEEALETEGLAMNGELQGLLDEFVSRANALVSPWGEARQSPSMDFDPQPLTELFLEIDRRLMDETGGPNMFGRVRHEGFRAEARRRLNAGVLPGYVSEIQSIRGGLSNYVALLGIAPEFGYHTYTARIASAGAAGFSFIFLKTTGIETSLEICWRHSGTGLTWKKTVHIGGLRLHGGVSSPGPDVAISLGSGRTSQPAYKATYLPPEYFDSGQAAIAELGMTGGMAGVAVSANARVIELFGQGGSSIPFAFGPAAGPTAKPLGIPQQGRPVKPGGELGVAVTGGGFTSSDVHGFEAPEVQDAVQLGTRRVPVCHARIHFATNSLALDDADRATLYEVELAMSQAAQNHPDGSFHVDIQGAHSQLGNTARNHQLANGRAVATYQGLESLLMQTAEQYPQDLSDPNHFRATWDGYGPKGTEASDNRASDRAADIYVYMDVADNASGSVLP